MPFQGIDARNTSTLKSLMPAYRQRRESNGGKQCLCASRVETSVSARHYNEKSPIVLKKQPRNISAVAIRGMQRWAGTDSGSAPSASCISILAHYWKPKEWRRMLTTALNRQRSALKSGCDATNAAARIIKHVAAAKIVKNDTIMLKLCH